MTCGEAREYLFAFLDSELDAPLSIELQRHLDGCPNCAREAEIERTIGKRLGRMLETAGPAVPALDDGVGHGLVRAGSVTGDFGGTHARVAVGPRRVSAVAAVILIMLGAGVWYVGGGRSAGVSPPRFADLLVNDFEHFLDEGSRVQLASGDPDVVAAWLRERTELAVVLPATHARQCGLIGSRQCRIGGRPAAFAVYDMKGVPASLVALAAERGDLAGMMEVREGSATYWVDRCKGFTIVACRRDELVYAAVSKTSQEELLCLMSGAVHESD